MGGRTDEKFSDLYSLRADASTVYCNRKRIVSLGILWGQYFRIWLLHWPSYRRDYNRVSLEMCDLCPIGWFQSAVSDEAFFLFDSSESMARLFYWIREEGGDIEYFETCPRCERDLELPQWLAAIMFRTVTRH